MPAGIFTSVAGTSYVTGNTGKAPGTQRRADIDMEPLSKRKYAKRTDFKRAGCVLEDKAVDPFIHRSHGAVLLQPGYGVFLLQIRAIHDQGKAPRQEVRTAVQANSPYQPGSRPGNQSGRNHRRRRPCRLRGGPIYRQKGGICFRECAPGCAER